MTCIGNTITAIRGAARAESVIRGDSAVCTLEDTIGPRHLRATLMGIRLAEERLLVVVEDITEQHAHARPRRR